VDAPPRAQLKATRVHSLLHHRLGVPVAVLPVIHLESERQAVEEAQLAAEVGAHGVMLIHHDCEDALVVSALLAVIADAREAGRRAPWVGVNLLGRGPRSAARYLEALGVRVASAVWSDSSGAERGRPAVTSSLVADPSRPLLFGGVRFKGQAHRGTVEAEAAEAFRVGVDVLTTSGAATGSPCDPRQVARIARVATVLSRQVGSGERAAWFRPAVAVASGVTPDNAGDVLRAGADALLVASGIALGDSFHRMDGRKLEALLERVQRAGEGRREEVESCCERS
jgi:predicted TIM-barrel enzyme